MEYEYSCDPRGDNDDGDYYDRVASSERFDIKNLEIRLLAERRKWDWNLERGGGQWVEMHL